MPIDTSMYNNNPMESGMQAFQNTMKMSQLAKQAREDNVIKAAYAKNTKVDPNTGATTVDQNGLMSDLGKGGAVDAFQQAQTQFAKQNQISTETKLAQMKLHNEQLGFIGQVGSSMTDQASYQNGLNVLKQSGIDVSDAPAQYDPNWVNTHKTMALTMKDQLNEHIKQQEADAKTTQAGAAVTKAQADKKKADAMSGATNKMYDSWGREFYSQNKGDIDGLKKYDDAKTIIKSADGSPVGPNLAQMDFVKAAVGRANWQEIQMADNNQSAKQKIARALSIQLTDQDTKDNTLFWNKVIDASKDATMQRLNDRADGFSNGKAAAVDGVNVDRLKTAIKQQHLSGFGAPRPAGATKAPPNGNQTVIQNGHTYNWNPQTGNYE